MKKFFRLLSGRLRDWLKALPPDGLMALLLGVWLVVNLLQAAFTGLADDEGYYHMFAQRLAWGYYDHPPMTALLVWLGGWIGGPLGVRFFFVVLQPLYFWIFWKLVRPAGATRSDVWLMFLIAAAIPLTQLYGFIAVPDVPLMMFTVVFLLCYKRLCDRSTLVNTLLLGLSMALLGYSKYHGALAVVFVLASNPRLFRRYNVYLAGVVALLLLAPHLLWQQAHDWVSLKYHLFGRNKPFDYSYPIEYILNLFAVFNPLFFVLYLRAGWHKLKDAPSQPTDVIRKALWWLLIGFVGFFLLSSIRGHVQPQWVIVATFPLVALLFDHVRGGSAKLRRYVVVSAWITIALVGLFRLEMIFNPLGIKWEIFDNRATYDAIAHEAQGRTVIFSGKYAIAAKYNFYTGEPAFGQPAVSYRSSQWEFRDDDTRAIGRQVLVETGPDKADPSITTIDLANSHTFSYKVIDDFRPVRKLAISAAAELPSVLHRGQRVPYKLTISNPYPYDVHISPDSLPALLVLRDAARLVTEVVLNDVRGMVPAGGSAYFAGSMEIPEGLPAGKYVAGFAVKPAFMDYWYNSPQRNIRIK